MKLEFKDFERMEEIDHQYFPPENIAPAEESYKWYLVDQRRVEKSHNEF